jgi:hypothetical protein
MKATYLAPIGSGIGDVIVALPVFEWLIARDEGPVYLVARGPRQLGFDGCISGLAGVVREVDLPEVIAQKINDEEACYINLRDHDIQRNYDWYGEKFSRDYPGFLITDIMAEVCRSFGLTPDFTRFPKLTSYYVRDVANKVAIIPGATSDFKALPAATWKSVIRELEKDGLQAIMLGEAERSPVVAELVEAGVAHYPTPLIQDAISALSSVRACISVDTGLMHIAVQQGTPTVAVFNNVHTYYRAAANCRPVFGPRCADECLAETGSKFPYPVEYPEWVWWEGVYEHCKSARPCMTQVRAEDILVAFKELSGRGLAQR